jgi:hypothetical protein
VGIVGQWFCASICDTGATELSSPTGFPFRFIRRTLEAQHKLHLDGIRPSVSVPYSVSCVAINAVKRAASNHDRSILDVMSLGAFALAIASTVAYKEL